MGTDYKGSCTCSNLTCKGNNCLFCGAFGDPCPQFAALHPIGRWETNVLAVPGAAERVAEIQAELWEVCINGFTSEADASDFIDEAFAASATRPLAAMIYPVALDTEAETL